jgi:hypothetical protein
LRIVVKGVDTGAAAARREAEQPAAGADVEEGAAFEVGDF